MELGYRDVAALAGGSEAWRKDGRPLESGLTGVTRPPDDVVPAGPDRSYADMINYLRWEEARPQVARPILMGQPIARSRAAGASPRARCHAPSRSCVCDRRRVRAARPRPGTLTIAMHFTP